MAACYLRDSVRVLLYLLYAYGDDNDAVDVLLANANAGGENVARGACLGACLGAFHGAAAWAADEGGADASPWVSGLVVPDDTHELIAWFAAAAAAAE